MDEEKVTCTHCGHELKDGQKLTGNIKSFEYTEYVHIGNMFYLREGLPDDHTESIPSLYSTKYGEQLPLDWREVLN